MFWRGSSRRTSRADGRTRGSRAWRPAPARAGSAAPCFSLLTRRKQGEQGGLGPPCAWKRPVITIHCAETGVQANTEITGRKFSLIREVTGGGGARTGSLPAFEPAGRLTPKGYSARSLMLRWRMMLYLSEHTVELFVRSILFLTNEAVSHDEKRPLHD